MTTDAARILLVEDSVTQAMKMQHFLSQHGLEVEHVTSAEAAIEQIGRIQPDLLITDLNLPGASGNDLCRQLRMRINTRGLPILLLTTEENVEIETRALECGADDFVRKSEEHDILLLRIQTLLRKSHVKEIVAVAETGLAAAKILIVEDSATYRELLLGELAPEGYQLKTAGTGEEALTLLAMEPFDAMVLDLVLPDMSGHEVCRRMVASRRTVDNTFMILALAGREDRDEMNMLLEAGADDVIGKSRDMNVIKARLRALVRRKLLFEENRRILNEFQGRERALLEERAERKVAETRAALVGQLEQANRELKEAQVQLVQSAKMASLGQLVAGIAHEVNNPLAFVMSYQHTVLSSLNTVAQESASALSENSRKKLAKAQERLGDMQMGLERIKDLVLQLRTFSRLDEGELKTVKIEENIESTITLLQHRIKDRIKLNRDYGSIKIVSCYPGPLNQVIMNILANAVDAIEGPGEITISTREEDAMLCIAVSDSGKGMSDDIKDRIFEPFFTTKPVGEGTGLGLPISYGIIQRHKGTLEVDSAVGRGTTMIVKIPLDARAATPSADNQTN